MTAPGRRPISYLPGRWTALVTDDFSLLGDVHLADPLLAVCWEASNAAGAEGPDGATAVLDVLGGAARERALSFVLVARTGTALRLVVAGRAHAEVFAGQQEPVVYGAVEGKAWVDERLDAAWDVRLVADDPTPFERLSPLPLTSGIVLASYLFSTAVAAPSAPSAPPESAAPAADDAVGWIPPPLAPASQEYPVPQAWADEPAPLLSGVFRALPWRSSLVEPEVPPAAPMEQAAPDPEDGDAGGEAASEPAPYLEPPAPDPWPAAEDKPSFGAPGYEPPPFGAEAYGSDDYAYAPPPSYPPPPAYPPPPPAVPTETASPEAPAAPLVQAVLCLNGHPNPLHVDACRVCGAGFAAQQPVTVERPPLGVLRLPTGETVPLDRDALLGRAPFAVDQRSVQLVTVPSPENDISRSHVRITLDGWQVFATDLGSTNGTAVTLPGTPPALLRSHDPFALTPGAVLSLADEADVRFDVS